MTTFQLKNGTLRIEEDTLLIEGGKPNLLKWLSFLVAIGWSLFFVYRGYQHYRIFNVSHNSWQLGFLIMSLLALGFWCWVAVQCLAMKGLDTIPMGQIANAQKVFRPHQEVPLVTLHLKNNRSRSLEFKGLDELYFTDALATRGIPVSE